MRIAVRALSCFVVFLIAGIAAAPPAPAGAASGLPTGKRQHKPLTVVKPRTAQRSAAQRLKNARQRRAVLKLIDALQAAKSRPERRRRPGRRGRSSQRNQSDMEFLRGRARRSGRGGGDVAMEELVLSHEGLRRVKSSYENLRRALGLRTDCVRKCEARKRRCRATCREAHGCACVVAASDCLLSEMQARRCSTAMDDRAWPAKIFYSGIDP